MNHAPVRRFQGESALSDAYAAVQTDDTIEDGTVIVSESTLLGLTVGFVYRSAWIATVHADQPEGYWERVGDMAALLHDNPGYIESKVLADATARHELAERARIDALAHDRQQLPSAARHAVDCALNAIDRRSNLHGDYVEAKRAYLGQLRVAALAVIADYQAENSHRKVSDEQALLEARCWFHQPDMDARPDTLVSAYALVSDADDSDLTQARGLGQAL